MMMMMILKLRSDTGRAQVVLTLFLHQYEVLHIVDYIAGILMMMMMLVRRLGLLVIVLRIRSDHVAD